MASKLPLLILLIAITCLSQFYRVSNSVIAPELTRDLGLSARQLGWAGSAFFFALFAVQIPVGMWFDRYGARRTVVALSILAIVGALWIAAAADAFDLIAARAVVGVGCAASFMSVVFLCARWFEPRRLSTVLSWVFTASNIGTLAAATPLAWVAGAVGWRNGFLGLATITLVVALLRVAGKVDLSHLRKREVRKILERGKTMVRGRDKDVVDVQQQAASCSAGDRTNEVGFAHGRFAKGDISRRIFEQYPPADRLLDFVDVIAHRGKRRFRIGQRQEIVEIGRLVRRPSEMLGHERGFVAFDEPAKAFEMRLVQRMRTSDRHAHAMQRNRVIPADSVERAMGRTASAHVVLGVDLEEAA